MPQYQFANSSGNIIDEDYNGSSALTGEEVFSAIKEAFSLFPHKVEIEQINNWEDVYRVHFEDDEYEDIYFCAKGTTPGGREGLKNEQRIQPKAKYLNYIYDKSINGFKGVFMGVYKKDNVTIFCTWNVTQSNAANEETPISKQIKITSIAKAIQEGFVQQDKGRGEFACAFTPAFLYFYLKNNSWLHKGPITELNEHINKDENECEINSLCFNTNIDSKFEDRNRIIFGAPGTGKSYGLKKDCEKLLSDTAGTYERVTFHPDYSYSQFVGTYKPVMDVDGKSIRYDFVPGPFMRVYVDALKSGRTEAPQPHLLIIEEINRAKVAAVFGDVFQLLDRDDNGVSEYEIQSSEDIRRYLAKELGGSTENYQRIRIPNNMFIWATMNSADQGVFPMDTAFKRRWSFEYLGINENEEQITGKGKIVLAGSDEPVEWNMLRKAINNKMSSSDFKINEDKLMGPFFLSKKVMESDESGMIIDPQKFVKAFKSKVIMYLYEDAVKQGKHRFFDGCSDTSKYSSICDAFDEIGISIFGSTFREDFYNTEKDD